MGTEVNQSEQVNELDRIHLHFSGKQIRRSMTGTLWFRLVIVVTVLIFMGCFSEKQEKPDIFLIIIDTLRADHLGCYGYERSTSPILDSLAASGTLFSRCQAQAPWTLPAHASIWTGLSVKSHMTGIRNMVVYGLDSEIDNIATLLKDVDYVTLGFVNVILISHSFGFANGFDHYSSTDQGHGRAAATVDEVLEWFSENRGNPRPKLTVIHLFDVHSPYDPPAPFDTKFDPLGTQGVTEFVTDSLGILMNPEATDHLMDMYDSEISWVDNQLGRLFSELRRSGIADNAYIVVTSDHGEEFFEHGSWSHGHSLYQEILHVPLIVSGPGISLGVIDSTPCGQFDILPVIAGFAGVPIPDHVEGIDLFNQVSPDRVIPSSGVIPGHSTTQDPREFESMCSILNGFDKGILNYFTMDEQLFNLRLDPGEHDPYPLDSLHRFELDNYWSTPPVGHPHVVRGTAVEIDLNDLGYL